MTYPIRTAEDFNLELMNLFNCSDWRQVRIEAELRDGTRWQVDGAKIDVSDLGVVKTFVLCVGPKEEK